MSIEIHVKEVVDGSLEQTLTIDRRTLVFELPDYAGWQFTITQTNENKRYKALKPEVKVPLTHDRGHVNLIAINQAQHEAYRANINVSIPNPHPLNRFDQKWEVSTCEKRNKAGAWRNCPNGFPSLYPAIDYFRSTAGQKLLIEKTDSEAHKEKYKLIRQIETLDDYHAQLRWELSTLE